MTLEERLATFYEMRLQRAASMSQPPQVDMNPKRIEMLRSLGYIR
jgi:hypothetical protein